MQLEFEGTEDMLECMEEAALLWKSLDEGLDWSEDDAFQSHGPVPHQENQCFS